jgi:hypothetical protein
MDVGRILHVLMTPIAVLLPNAPLLVVVPLLSDVQQTMAATLINVLSLVVNVFQNQNVLAPPINVKTLFAIKPLNNVKLS